MHEAVPGKKLSVEWMLLELTSLQRTKEFAMAFKEKNLPLHVLINNAGVGGVPFGEPAVYIVHTTVFIVYQLLLNLQNSHLMVMRHTSK